MRFLNLGILAHVDAGKTSLTERLLFTTGVIRAMGSVNAGNTQTDSLALERQRGITIKSAVAAFTLDDMVVNLIDTPGHPDFIAEVERVLNVLDGVVLVISAVEGVQAQTRVLMRVLQRLRIPTLIFVNKIDRRGAQYEPLLQRIAAKLSPAIIAMGTTTDLGSPDAVFQPFAATDPDFAMRLIDRLANQSETLLGDYLADEQRVTFAYLTRELAQQTGQALVHPLFFGSAITGTGTDALIAGIKTLLPVANTDTDRPVAGTVFKIERGQAKEKIAYVRLFAGTLQVRDRLPFGKNQEGRITAMSIFEPGTAVRGMQAQAGQIVKLWGLNEIQVGDQIGAAPVASEQHFFAPPTLETIIVARQAAERNALHTALTQLTEQDPLINLRRDDMREELFVSLYGEVQKEVIQATLRDDFQIEAAFQETTPICVEHVLGTGEALDLLGKGENPFLATIGLRIEPAPPNTGMQFRIEANVETLPLYVYKSVEAFQQTMAETITEVLNQGLYGWQISDCNVIMTHSGYTSPSTGARDFRLLTPLVLMEALRHAGTCVCEPMQHFQVEIPGDALGPILSLLARLHAIPQPPSLRGAAYIIEGDIPAAHVHELQQMLPGISHGEGVLEYSFGHYTPITGTYPTRRRTDNNPLNRKEYLLHVLRRV